MIPIGVPLGGKVTVGSHMSYLIKGLSDGSIFIVGGYYVSVSFKNWNQRTNL